MYVETLDFDKVFSNCYVYSNCPNCNSKISFKLLQSNKEIICPNCSSPIDLKDYDTHYEDTKLFNDSLQKLKALFENFRDY